MQILVLYGNLSILCYYITGLYLCQIKQCAMSVGFYIIHLRRDEIGSSQIDNAISSLEERLLVSTVYGTVINLSEEVFVLLNISVLCKIQGKDSQMSKEQNNQNTNIINSKPLVGSFSSDSCTGGDDCGHHTCCSS